MATIKRLLASLVFGVLVIGMYVTREVPNQILPRSSNNLNTKRDQHENNTFEPLLPKTNRTIKVSQDKRQTAVFLVSQCRSGSSIIGELFNRRANVTFLYEPLYPFREFNGRPLAEALVPKSVEAVEAIARCNFTRLPELYREGFASSKQPDNYGCMKNGLCFTDCEKCSLFLSRDAHGVARGAKVDLVKLEHFCKKSEFVAAKLNYVRGVRNLKHLLTRDDVDVRIIYLTRDPRATIRSRIKARKIKNRTLRVIRSLAKELCGYLTEDTNFVQNVMTSAARGKVLSIRHEDFAINPVDTAKSIYNFIGKPQTPHLLKWVKSATDGSGGGSKFSTHRNTSDVITAWRSLLNLEEVTTIQEMCADALRLLSYKVYNSESELRDLSVPSF